MIADDLVALVIVLVVVVVGCILLVFLSACDAFCRPFVQGFNSSVRTLCCCYCGCRCYDLCCRSCFYLCCHCCTLFSLRWLLFVFLLLWGCFFGFRQNLSALLGRATFDAPVFMPFCRICVYLNGFAQVTILVFSNTAREAPKFIFNRFRESLRALFWVHFERRSLKISSGVGGVLPYLLLPGATTLLPTSSYYLPSTSV